MWNHKNRIRRTVRRKKLARAGNPMVEAVESRLLMANNVGFLQGMVFLDSSNNQVGSPNNHYPNPFAPGTAGTVVPGATVELFQGSSTSGTPYQTTTSAANGSYSFTGLAPGIYTLLEVPPSGYSNESTPLVENQSILNPVQGTTASSITVQVVDPSQLTLSFDSGNPSQTSTTTGEFARKPGGIQFTYVSGTQSTDEVFTIGQLPVTATGPSGFKTQEFAAFCVNVVDGLDYTFSTPDTFGVDGQPTGTGFNTTGDAGRIAYLYDQYMNYLCDQFNNPLSNTAYASTDPFTSEQAYEAQALQLAIWKLEYDSVPNTPISTNPSDASFKTFWSSGNVEGFSLVGGTGIANDPGGITDLESRAAQFINDSDNQSGQVTSLQAIQGSHPSEDGYQSLIAPGSLNFSNILKASPAIDTVAGGTVIVGSGTELTDTAVLSGGSSPTGTITFTLTAPGNTVVDTESVTVTGDNTYTTPTGYTPNATGTYVWSASYSGDSNNNGAADNGQNETEAVTPASPVINTVAGGTVVVGSGIPLTDTAALSGGYSPTGSITFTLTFNGSTVDTETVTVNGDNTYTTPGGYTPTTTGTYVWSASYSGDSNNNGATDDGRNETETVGPASPAINTVAAGTVIVGSGIKLTDTAVLSGGDSPTGIITFTLTGPGNTVVDTETVNVTGDNTYTTPGGYTPTAIGTFVWSASYSGDSNNNGATDNGQNESETVGPASPVINTVAGGTVIVASGTPLTDTAVLSGGSSPTGTITFTLTAPGNTVVNTETVNVTGDNTYTTPGGYTPTAIGTFVWSASYSGDSNNNGATDNGQNESETVGPASPVINTVAGGTVIVASGTELTDTAVLSGGYSPTGLITFTLTFDGSTVDTETVTVNGDNTYTTPSGYLPTATGSYLWSASYSGDSNNNGATDNGQNESETVGPASPVINTVAGGTVIVGSGTELTDTAVLSGGSSPTGTITFTLTGPGNTVVDTESVTVTGDNTYTTPNGYLPTATGIYLWSAIYSGDSNNNGATDNGQNESETVGPASPTINTVAGGTVIVGGGSKLTDNAVLSGGYNPSGTITFTLTYNGSTVDTETVNVTGDNTYTTPTGYTPNATGTYVWSASYGGDSNNNGATDNSQNESETVGPAQPTLITTASSPVTLGITAPTLTDSAVLSAGYLPDGLASSITFTLKLGSTTVYTTSDTVSGDGTYTASYTLPTTGAVTGTYTWSASYSGDADNAPAHDQGGTAEQIVVSPASPAINTTPGGSVAIGSGAKLTDSASLSGAYNPTGTISFYLFAPGVTPNGSDSNNVYSDTVSVSGNGTYTTAGGNNPGGYLPTATGTYQWVAVYGGDGNNVKTAGDFGNEPEMATASSPTITTTPGGTVALGSFTISGIKYLDATGNGFSSDDTPQSGVTLDLYQVTGGTQTLVATTTTASNGTYSFTETTPGTYEVYESVPSGYIQTGGGPNGSTGHTYYTINAAAGANDSGNNFDDYLLPNCNCASSNVNFTVTTPGGSSSTVTSLGGKAAQGDTVTANITVPARTTEQLTLMVYTAPSPSFSNSNAYQQVIYQQQTGTWTAGSQALKETLKVTIPNTYYQIDFVCGPAIGQLEPNQNNNAYGPDSADILYTPQGRLITSDNGGCTAPNPMPSPTPATPPGPVTVATPPVTLNDSATLSGGSSPTGTVTFYLFAPGVTPNGSDSNNVYSDKVTISGDGTYTTAGGNKPGGYVPTTAGTYQWVAVYSGDTNNSGATSPFGSEPEKVTPACTTITTTPGGSVILGGLVKLTDSAALSNGDNPTGTITFYLFAPGVTPNGSDSNNVYSDTVTVNGNGIYTTSTGSNSGGYTPTKTGTYQWLAVYSGDTNNTRASDCFGNEPEPVNQSCSVGWGQYASCGFWQSKSGQSVICNFGNGASDTCLGNWLANNFPNLFGCSNPYISSYLNQCGASSLSGLTNSQIATLCTKLSTGGTNQNAFAQAFACALGIYADTTSFGGNAAAQGSGFSVNWPGGSGATYNVGGNGSAFGVSNYSNQQVCSLLQSVNNNFSPSSGSFYGGNSSKTGSACNVLGGINSSGNIDNAATLATPAGSVAYTPAQIRDAYGINNLTQDGTGQTIAIVDAYNDPNIAQAVNLFDSQFGLTDSGPTLYSQYGPASSFLTVLNQSGQTTSLPATDPSGPGTDNWEVEESLDVEWAHAIAPGARIVLVEANSQSLSDLMAAVGTAAHQPGVSVVTMSWGFPEGQSVFAANEANYDKVFDVPGVTFLASTGDYGTADPEYPAFSPNVVAVGGTTLTLGANNSYGSETTWGGASGAGTTIGSGGGLSQYESEPSYQQGVQSTGSRTTPDVVMDANPSTGAWVADPYDLNSGDPFEVVGGTSLSAPSFAGLVALVNQGRTVAGEVTLNSTNPTQAQQALYSLPQADYHTISGGNGSSAHAGYSLGTGLGSPVANLLVPGLIAYHGPGTTPASPTGVASHLATFHGTGTVGGGFRGVFSAIATGTNGLGLIQADGVGMLTAGMPATALTDNAATAPVGSVVSAAGHAQTQTTAGATILPASAGQAVPTIAWSTAQPGIGSPTTDGFAKTVQLNTDVLPRIMPRTGLVSDSVLEELAADSALWQGRNWDGTVTIPVFPAESVAGAAAPSDPTVRQDPHRSPPFAERLAVLGLAAGLSGGAGIIKARKRRSGSPSLPTTSPARD